MGNKYYNFRTTMLSDSKFDQTVNNLIGLVHSYFILVTFLNIRIITICVDILKCMRELTVANKLLRIKRSA